MLTALFTYLFIYLFINALFTAQVLKVFRTPGPTAWLKMPSVFKKLQIEKKSMTGPGQPQSLTLTGVCQAVRIIFFCVS